MLCLTLFRPYETGKYDSYYPSNHILRANIQENMTHNVLPPMGVSVCTRWEIKLYVYIEYNFLNFEMLSELTLSIN